MNMRSGLLAVEQDRVQAHPARARRPLADPIRGRAGRPARASFAAVGGAEQRRVLDAGISRCPDRSATARDARHA